MTKPAFGPPHRCEEFGDPRFSPNNADYNNNPSVVSRSWGRAVMPRIPAGNTRSREPLVQATWRKMVTASTANIRKCAVDGSSSSGSRFGSLMSNDHVLQHPEADNSRDLSNEVEVNKCAINTNSPPEYPSIISFVSAYTQRRRVKKTKPRLPHQAIV